MTNQNKTEEFPFRRVAIASFIKGLLSILFGVILLLLIKSDLSNQNYFRLGIKVVSAVSFLTIGFRSVWRGYLKEYNFSLKDVFDRTRNIKINNLLGQRVNHPYDLAEEYVRVFDSKNVSYTDEEKGKVSNWQFIFFKLVSKKGLSDIFDYVPYQITNFINNQSKPVSIFGFLVMGLIVLAFISYLGILQFNLFWINLGILLGLLALWQPSKINYLTKQNPSSSVVGKLFLFTVLYILTVFFYKPSGYSLNVVLFLIIILLFAIIAYTAWMSFKIVEEIFVERRQIGVEVSDIDLKTIRVATQPSNIKQQFENILKKSTGWYFSFDYDKQNRSGEVRGEQKHKGDFNFQNVYESNPKIISTVYDSVTEKKLSMLYILGIILTVIGLTLIFIGILIFPNIVSTGFKQLGSQEMQMYASSFISSLFCSLIGIALLSFGNRLIYEIFIFFNSEVFFESSLILMKAYGSYDEYEHKANGIKRKDTFADFTPDIEVCQVKSSIFIHPYLESKHIESLPRYIVQVAKNDGLLDFLIEEFKKNLNPYLLKLDSGSNTPRIEDSNNDDLLD